MTRYWRPIPVGDVAAVETSVPLAGGPVRFAQVEVLTRDAPPAVVPITQVPDPVMARLSAPRAPICGLTMDQTRIMGILNVTPDSFSDGGDFTDRDAAVAQARAMAQDADILDIGGESTRPGADFVPETAEIARTVPVIDALEQAGVGTPISIDTRKAGVAQATVAAGARLFNDVSALSFDPDSLAVAARLGVPVCLMHASGDPKTMQADPRYSDVVLDVYDYLDARVAAAETAGIDRANLIVDPGIGFGKTAEHNLALLRRISVFHGLGCPVLLGVSRKRFIGTLGHAPEARDRFAGSMAVALDAVRQGVQILRVHDVAATAQALRLHRALHLSRS